jgi:Fe-S oxidoreductase
MAGAFGYEKEHYEFSMKVGELSLFPTIRQTRLENNNCLVCTSGVSCHAQILDGSGIEPFHPVELVYKNIKKMHI